MTETIENNIVGAITDIIKTAPDSVAKAEMLYDAAANQKIPLTVTKGGKSYDVAIELSKITADEYFQLMEDIPNGAKRIKTVSVDLFAPYAALGKEKAVARYGYKNRDDWRVATRDSDYISAVKSYLDVSAQTETVETGDLLDDDDETAILLISNFGGRETNTSIFFREETKAEMDEYLAALGDQPQKNAIASNKKISKERRLFALYEAMTTRGEGYADGKVPVWHGIEAVAAFFNVSLARLGKF